MRDEIEILISKGLTKKEISNYLGIGYSTVKKYSKDIPTLKKNNAFKCKICGDSNKENFYDNKSSASYYCKPCWNQKTYKSARDKISSYMNSRGGAKCLICGYNKCTAALEFHHRDPTEKDPSWSIGWSLPRLKKELDKCDILCANCHREVHHLKQDSL